MEWFKFYGKDWLTDTKIIMMSIEDRLCFLTLLCLASASDEQGVIKKCNEDAVIQLTHLYNNPYDDDNEVSRAKGFLKRLIDNEMITPDNNGNVIINNFTLRQAQKMTGYERVKKYRDKKKSLYNTEITDDNTGVINDNAMITLDKKRIDKKRISSFFENYKDYEIKQIEDMYNYVMVDEDGNPLTGKSKSIKITKAENNFLISIGFLWAEAVSKHLSIPPAEVVLKNINYPIRALYNRDKFKREDFEKLFKYFLNDPKIPYESKMAFDLCMSPKYAVQFKLAQKSAPKTNSSISGDIRL